MRKYFYSVLVALFIIFGFTSGFFQKTIEFFCWLFLFENSAPETSVVGGIVVRVLTVPVSFGLVGMLFSWVNFLDGRTAGKIMSIGYVIVSAFVSFALAYVVWLIESYTIIVIIVFVLLLLGIFLFFLIKWLKEAKENEVEVSKKDNKKEVDIK